MAGRRSFGSIDKRASGLYRARHKVDGRWVSAPMTFRTKAEAEIYLDSVRTDMVRSVWKAPKRSRLTLEEYGGKWIAQRSGIKASTRVEYESCWRNHIGPYLGKYMLDAVTPDVVRDWHAQAKDRLRSELRDKDREQRAREERLAKTSRKDRKPRVPSTATLRDGSATVARAYRLLHSVMQTAEDDELIARNPCRLKGASAGRPAERPTLSTPEVESLAAEVPERYAALVQVLVWSGLRIGEAAALQRRDLDLREGAATLSVRERVYPVAGVHDFDSPKSVAGQRTIAIPRLLADSLRTHLERFSGPRFDDLVFTTQTGGNIRSTYHQMLKRALLRVGRPDVRPHDLRHTGMTLAAQAGASLPELKHRMGQSTTRAAEIYLHATADHGRRIADRMDQLAQEPSNVRPIVRRAPRPQH